MHIEEHVLHKNLLDVPTSRFPSLIDERHWPVRFQRAASGDGSTDESVSISSGGGRSSPVFVEFENSATFAKPASPSCDCTTRPEPVITSHGKTSPSIDICKYDSNQNDYQKTENRHDDISAFGSSGDRIVPVKAGSNSQDGIVQVELGGRISQQLATRIDSVKRGCETMSFSVIHSGPGKSPTMAFTQTFELSQRQESPLRRIASADDINWFVKIKNMGFILGALTVHSSVRFDYASSNDII